MRKVEIDLDAHAEQLRDYEAARERHRIGSNRVRNLENELASAKYERDEASKKLAAASATVAASFLDELLPRLHEPVAVGGCTADASGPSQGSE